MGNKDNIDNFNDIQEPKNIDDHLMGGLGAIRLPKIRKMQYST